MRKMKVRSDPADVRYSRNAAFYDILNRIGEALYFSRFRRDLLSRVKGRVLEIGVGTGKSFRDYPSGLYITAVDINDRMLKRAAKRAKNYRGKVELKREDVQHLSFKDESFESVFTSWVFCSVTDPVRGLREIRGVLKKDGQLLMLEHVRSKGRIVGLLMDALNPFVVRVWGENINRDTVRNLRKAGLKVKKERNLVSDIVKAIVATK